MINEEHVRPSQEPVKWRDEGATPPVDLGLSLLPLLKRVCRKRNGGRLRPCSGGKGDRILPGRSI